MNDMRAIDMLLGDAIALLEDNGFPLAADSLRDTLRAIRTAPTAGARRRRVFQLRDLFEGMGPGLDVFFCSPHQAATGLRFRRNASHRRDQERYRRTLAAIQEILAGGAGDEVLEPGWTPSPVGRVA